MDCPGTHLGEAGADVIRQRAIGWRSREMLATCTASAPIRSMSAPTWIDADHRPQIASDGLLQREQLSAVSSAWTAHGRDVFVVGDDLFGQR